MENEPTVFNVEERARLLVLGMSAMVSLSEFCESMATKDNNPLDVATSALLKELGLNDNILIEKFLEEFTASGMAGEA